MFIAHDRKAWNEGFQAGEAGRPRCPYQATTTQSYSWQALDYAQIVRYRLEIDELQKQNRSLRIKIGRLKVKELLPA